jgi:hypothetical protein
LAQTVTEKLMITLGGPRVLRYAYGAGDCAGRRQEQQVLGARHGRHSRTPFTMTTNGARRSDGQVARTAVAGN